MQKPKVGVVVVTHNSQDFIYSCLKSVIDNTFPDLEIVVVDNASSDSTISVIKKNFKVKIIKNEKGLGFVAANNIGIKFLIKKGMDYILQINPDAISSPELVEKLLGVFKKDPKIGVCGCIITYSGKRGKVWFAGGYFNRLFCYTRHKFMDKELKAIKPNRPIHESSSANPASAPHNVAKSRSSLIFPSRNCSCVVTWATGTAGSISATALRAAVVSASGANAVRMTK